MSFLPVDIQGLVVGWLGAREQCVLIRKCEWDIRCLVPHTKYVEENLGMYTTKMVGWVLKNMKVDPGAGNNAALWWALENNHVSKIKMLLADPRVDPGAQENGALCFASIHGCTEVVGVLLADPRVDPSAQQNAAVWLASKNGHFHVVKLLLADSRVDPGANKNIAYRESCTTYPRVGVLLKTHPRVIEEAERDNAWRRYRYWR